MICANLLVGPGHVGNAMPDKVFLVSAREFGFDGRMDPLWLADAAIE
jgi:hypothetical protein